MTLNEYQEQSKATCSYPQHGEHTDVAINYCLVALGGEVGEVLNKWKKVLRGDNEYVDREQLRRDLMYELGDVFWYISQAALELDIKLEDVATYNLAKLASRKGRNTIKGSGDVR